MMKKIDDFLNSITMYRLMLYSLIILLGIAAVLGYFSKLPYSPLSIILSAIFLVAVSWLANFFIAKAFEVPVNVESAYITALILALIVSPAHSLSGLPFLFWTAVLAMASKYILAIRKKHLFNPAAIAVVITGLTLGESASWWAGTVWMAPFVAVVGFLIIRKLHFEDLVWSFFMIVLVVSLGFTLIKGGDLINSFYQTIFQSSYLFLGTIMLTEPLTMPPRKLTQMFYGGIVGLLAVPQVHVGSFYFTPELALCTGNIFSYIISPKTKLLLHLQEKRQIASDIMEFVFKRPQKFSFIPGQYMEWTVPHQHSDSRGNRRYFTLASSPTENTIRLGIRFYQNGSTYKRALSGLDNKISIVGAQLAGDFVLPKNPEQKLVFIAGGIGITPFRSMVQYLIDKNEKRDIVLFYANKTEDEIAYRDVFSQAQNVCGLKVVYTITDTSAVPQSWQGSTGRINAQMIRDAVPDFKQRIFYLSGPHAMVTAYEQILKNMGVKNTNIKKDFFPGFV